MNSSSLLSIDIVVVGRHGEMMRAVLLPLLPALSGPLGASDYDTGGCGWATADVRSRLSQSEGGPDSLLTGGVPGCNVEQLHGGFWFLTAELMNQRAERSAIPEG
jgi:hypothetical protein